MKRSEAITWAERIARLILRGSTKVGRTSFGLMSALSIMAAARKKEVASFDPRVKEIVLFGSTARQGGPDDQVGDVDLMVFDEGFYSNVMSVEPTYGICGDSGTFLLRSNLWALIEGWFEFSRNDSEVKDILSIPSVDLHVLPIGIFTSRRLWKLYAAKHRDPRFFKNAFSAMMRFDPALDRFVPVDLAYFMQPVEERTVAHG